MIAKEPIDLLGEMNVIAMTSSLPSKFSNTDNVDGYKYPLRMSSFRAISSYRIHRYTFFITIAVATSASLCSSATLP